MPELPEVETTRIELLPHIVGHQISRVTVFWDKIIRFPSVNEFSSRISGRRIVGLRRRGKYLIFDLDNGEKLIIHLKMSGSLLLTPASAETERYTNAIIYLDNEMKFCFRDPRKFGKMWLVSDIGQVTGRLGPEPLEVSFTPKILARRISKRTAPIKAILCDQSFVAGIGNMYADEVLFAAGIHPLRVGKVLSRVEVERLYSAIQKILCEAISNKGASVVNYFRPGGEIGTAHWQFKVAHMLSGKSCPVCSTPLQRIEVRQRGTYFCPRCQPVG